MILLSNRRWRQWWLGVLLLAIAPAGLEAAADRDRTLSPYFFIDNGDPEIDRLPLKQTDVKVNISGVIADVSVRQTYANDGGRPITARYIFPASTRAAVHGMKMAIGNQVITAKIRQREAAQKQFDHARSEGKSASLLNQQRPNVFSMDVANILPGSAIEIELSYTELLVPTDGIYEFVYPTVVGPRYSNQNQATAPKTDPWIRTPYLPQGSAPNTRFNIAAKLSAGVPLEDLTTPSHRTDIFHEGDSAVSIALSDPETFSGDRDYILRYRLAGKEIRSGLMLFEERDEKFFLLMVQPPERLRAEDIPPREFVFIIDVSGSMHGFPMDVSKKLLKDLIGGLRPTDKFNVILFAGGSRVMAPESLPATTENIQRAIEVIEQQRGGGGTELLAAVRAGFSLPRDPSYARTMLIVTDGYIEAEKKVFEEIRRNLDRTNVFAFGIGSSVNRHLIEGIAKAGQGEPFVVLDPAEAPGAAARFRQYVQFPVLTDIAVSYAGFDAYDVEPAGVHDLFADRPVILFGKWHGAAHGTITVSGTGGRGLFSQTFDVSRTQLREVNRPLRYLWARARIARLSDFAASAASENRDEIVNLGLTYNLMTAHTSFIAVNEVVRNSGGSEDVDQPLPLPLHVSNFAVGMSAVPEPQLGLLLGLSVLLFLLVMLHRKAPRIARRGSAVVMGINRYEDG